MEWFNRIVDVLKSPKLAAALAVASALLLFIPEVAVLKPFLPEFRKNFGQHLVLGLAAGVALLLVELGPWIYRRFVLNRARKAAELKVFERLLRLDANEQIIMREFIIQARNTIKLPMNQAVVAGLQQAGLITLIQAASHRSLAGPVGVFTLSPPVSTYFFHPSWGYRKGPQQLKKRNEF